MTSIVAWNFCRVELIIFSAFVCLYRRIIQWDIKAADAILVCSLRNESGNTEEVAGVSALCRQRDNWSWRLSDVKSTFIIILVCQCLRCGKEQCIASAASCPFFQTLAITVHYHTALCLKFFSSDVSARLVARLSSFLLYLPRGFLFRKCKKTRWVKVFQKFQKYQWVLTFLGVRWVSVSFYKGILRLLGQIMRLYMKIIINWLVP